MTARRVLVTGSRKWKDRTTVRQALDAEGFAHGFDGMTVVHGACPNGADAIADEWVGHNTDLGVTAERHPADWKRHGKPAGPIRNTEMVDTGADVCLAFIHQSSPGASNTLAQAERAGIPVKRFDS